MFPSMSGFGGDALSFEIQETSEKKRKVVALLDPFDMTHNGTVEVVCTHFFFF